MSDWEEFSAETVDEALTNALVQLETTSANVEYEVLEKETKGILGIGHKPAKIRARVKDTIDSRAVDFLNKVFSAMNMEVKIDISIDTEENIMNIELSGDQMGILIGKRGATLDSLQYLLSLIVNKGMEQYTKVKLDTENYRERRKETLENLAKNLAHKVKRVHHSVYLEPMNPYERRIIHFALQDDKYVETHSEGTEPYRKVVISLKPGMEKELESKGHYGNRSYSGHGGSGYKKRYDRSNYSYDDKKSYGGSSYEESSVETQEEHTEFTSDSEN